jgi:FixJ family two-component response regulator
VRSGNVVAHAAIISIVDDDAWARDGIEALVSSLGYAAITFSSAEQFIGSGCLEQADCVITDLQMPGLSGFDLQNHISQHGFHTPVIFITAYADENHRSRALDAGAVGFLSKPIDESALVKCLADAIEIGRAGASGT